MVQEKSAKVVEAINLANKIKSDSQHHNLGHKYHSKTKTITDINITLQLKRSGSSQQAQTQRSVINSPSFVSGDQLNLHAAE